VPRGGDRTAAATVHAHLQHRMASAQVGRRVVEALLAGHDVASGLVRDAGLVVHELVVNAVRHGAPGPEGTVELWCVVETGSVEVSVVDGGAEGDVEVLAPDDERPTGRGLVMVEGLSRSWSVDRSTGTRVTAHFDL
jgi:serine/threonine-protein kinase RsbW